MSDETPGPFIQDDVAMLESSATELERLAAWCPPGHVNGLVDEIANRALHAEAERLRSIAAKITTRLHAAP